MTADATTHRTEQVYDGEMFPLVAKLIEIAKRENMPLLVSAGMLGPDGEPMMCSTLIGAAKADRFAPGIDNRYGLAHGIVRGHSGFDTAAGLIITRYHEPETK